MDLERLYESWKSRSDFPTDDRNYSELDLGHAFRAGAYAARNMLTPKEWEVLASLAGTGVDECPWAWESDWPKGIGEEEIARIMIKFREFLQLK